MKLRIVHVTTYEYDDLVTTSHHETHLRPRDAGDQSCLSHTLEVTPTPATMHERTDYFKNSACYFHIDEPHRSLRIVARSEVRVNGRGGPQSLPLHDPSWERVRDLVAGDRRPDLLNAYSFTFDSPYVRIQPALRELALPSFPHGRSLLEATRNLTKRIFEEFTYDPMATQVSTPLGEVMRHRRGVCQDFAHLEIGCLRSLGLPARYVSGYLLTSPPPGKPRLVGADASHAWASTYVPDLGWVDFDPANNVVPSDNHVRVSHGRDFGDVTPVRGVILGGGRHMLRVSVDVAPVDDESSD